MHSRTRLTLAVAVVTYFVVSGLAIGGRGAAQQVGGVPPPGQNAGQFFKNVTTSTLKTLSVDDFITAMGVISDDLGLDCADCHPNAGTDQADFVVDTPIKKTARRMVEMVANINKQNFGGAQMVTCWTCHHQRMIPATTISLDRLYDTPNMEEADVVEQEKGGPTADKVFADYMQAIGGEQKAAAIKSYIAEGTSVGYAGLGGDAKFTIYAEAPNKRTTEITYPDHPDRGTSLWAFDGMTGWVKTPRALLTEYELTGDGLDAARFEAYAGFPTELKGAAMNWRVGRRSIGDSDYLAVQGNGPKGFLVTLYFDPKTHLLFRMLRLQPLPVGRGPVQTDYGDYRAVNGVKLPFDYNFKWLDGRYEAKIKDYKVNVPIPASTFGKH